MKKLGLSIMLLLTVLALEAQNRSYITRVFDFMPAPGQFVNMLPKYTAGEPRDSVLARVLADIGGDVKITTNYDDDFNPISTDTVVTPVTSSVISLGSYGGYVIFGFDHPVVNVNGEYDLQIFGNSFNGSGSSTSGSSEPGIVMVGVDTDGDGVPSDGDQWYELAGSEYANPKTQHDFTITYYKPDENKDKVPDPVNSYLNDTEYVRWTCNSTDSLTEGYVARNTFHNQSYWPQWAEGETLTFSGAKLRCNAENTGQNGSQYYVQYFLDWGYVDNRVDYDWTGSLDDAIASNKNIGFNLDWAVDEQGNPVRLNQVDFIKVYNGVLQYCGWLGETSTEVKGAIDLHPDATVTSLLGDVNGDGTVDVGDVNILTNILLGSTSQSDYPSCDLNNDGNIDVGDINVLINIVLGK